LILPKSIKSNFPKH